MLKYELVRCIDYNQRQLNTSWQRSYAEFRRNSPELCSLFYEAICFVLPCIILFLCFSVLLALRLPRSGKGELILVLFVRLFDFACLVLSASSSSWCLGRAAVCDCGTPWTFLLPFFDKPVYY